jgi:hypothetical protein
MNEEFITNGIKNDRFLKALTLVDQFESEMVREIRNVAEATAEQAPALFVDDPTPQKSVNLRRNSPPLGNMRMDTKMSRVNASGERLTWNLAIEWAQPAIHGHDEPRDQALCVVLYKIKDCPTEDYQRVKRATRQESRWDAIQFDDDVWNSDWGIFYIPVTSGPEIKDGFQTLQEHFLEFGEQFGEPASTN